MKITKIELRKVALPMKGSFTTGFGSVSSKEVVIVVLYTADGLIGYGESATLPGPVYNHETVDTCLLIQEKFIAPSILGKNFETAEEFCAAYAFVVGNNMAKAGIECAFWHLLAQRDNVSLKQLFGGVKSEIKVGEGIGIKDSVEATLQEAETRLNEGYARIKLKIRPGWDVKPVQAVRERWPSIELTADGNSAYNLEEHAAVLQKLDAYKLSMLEQPFAADDFVSHAALQKRLQTPICLDESVASVDDAYTAFALNSCQIINIKPGRVGGILTSIKIHDAAAQHNIGVWCGGLLETGIGRAFNMALASKENFRYAADMSPYELYFAEDLTTPGLRIKQNGCMDVSDKPGLGYDIQEDVLKKYTVQTVTVE